MVERQSKKAAAVCIAALALALVPTAALAEPGSDQYCDPFGGCGNSGQTGGGHSHKGGNRGSHNQLSPEQLAKIMHSLEFKSLSAKQQAAALSGEDPATLARFRKDLETQQARNVLEAAGLSALRPTVSHR